MYLPIEQLLLSDSESEGAKVFEEEAKMGKGNHLSEEDLQQWWLIGEVQDKDWVDKDASILLCDSIDRRVGKPLMVRTQSTADGSKTSAASSGAKGEVDEDDPEPSAITKADEKLKANWRRDRHGKIVAEKERRRQDLLTTRQSLENALKAITDARKEVLLKDANISLDEDPN